MNITICANCGERYPTKPVQVRVLFGIHPQGKRVFSDHPVPWCVRCRQSNDGKWRYVR